MKDRARRGRSDHWWVFIAVCLIAFVGWSTPVRAADAPGTPTTTLERNGEDCADRMIVCGRDFPAGAGLRLRLDRIGTSTRRRDRAGPRS